ncbi:alpha/beta hydrolase-fold protein [Clostridium sp.]|uniref:alpha/beta hydrolase-fold protein n=1 Tax=Clostridium sp. TaxID=1506 RepID=UPI0032171A7D
MKKSLLKSMIILQLEEQIKKYGDKAIEEFLCDLKDKGAPIIEELENDDKNNLVTFIHEGDKACKNVLFVPDIGLDRFKDNYKDFQMQRIMETDLWYITYEVRNDLRFIYYFSPNDPLDDNWNDRFCNRVIYDRFSSKVLTFKGENGEEDSKSSYVIMPKSSEDTWAKKIDGVEEGNVEEYKFESKNLEDKRRVRVYTPYRYNKEEKPYRFIIFTDGNDYIDVLSSVETLNNLIAFKKIPPIVAIFIDSTENRGKELKCSDSFCEIIIKELIPWVRENYNITKSPEEAIICGLSLGALTASYLGLNYSDIFGNVLSQSGYYWYNSEDFAPNEDCWITTKFKEVDRLPLKFYFDMGVLETKYKIIDTNINLRDALISKGYNVDFKWFNGGHDYLSWGESLAHGLISLVGIKQYELNDMFNCLSHIGSKLNEANVLWSVGGSILLNHFGLLDKPNDIDILVGIDDIKKVEEILDNMGQKKIWEKTDIYSTQYFYEYIINGVEVDVMSELSINHSNGVFEYDFDYKSISDMKDVSGVSIPLTSLEDWYVLYQLIPNRESKVVLIENYLLSNGVKNQFLLERALRGNLPIEIKNRAKTYFLYCQR